MVPCVNFDVNNSRINTSSSGNQQSLTKLGQCFEYCHQNIFSLYLAIVQCCMMDVFWKLVHVTYLSRKFLKIIDQRLVALFVFKHIKDLYKDQSYDIMPIILMKHWGLSNQNDT
jgi:hypothetical protein